MKFQRARTEEQFINRQEEIINACDILYHNIDFENVTIKAISEMTSFTRPSIYNYYKTREEIFLDLLQREYLRWHDELKAKFDSTEAMTKTAYCRFLTASLIKREKMLKLLSIHLTAIENNCRLEKLAEFKKACSVVFIVFAEGLDKFFPATSTEKKNEFRSVFFIYIFGLYPFTHLTEKQQAAMKLANLNFNYLSFETLCFNGISLLASKLIEPENIR